MVLYVVHPGYVTLYSNNQTVYIDAGTLATNYGLVDGEYLTSTTLQETSQDGSIMHIHLFPRPDGKYKSIKASIYDNGTDTFVEKPVGWKRYRKERRKYF